ncbi:MAG: GntR family transcriptional regulator [Desulfobacterales bacterium]|nr:MAG: GntR family transcriptional regulator [Desulfobacterales bacterium]
MRTYDDVNNKLTKYKVYLIESDLPLYYQVAYVLEHFLSSNILKPGTRFFSEEEISSQLEVSRPTVNRAINILIKNDYLKRIRGKGTIVQKLKGVSLVLMSSLLSFGEMVDKIGRRHHTDLLERNQEKSLAAVSNALGINPGDSVIHLKRLRFIDNKPLIVVDSYLPFSRFSKLLEIDEKSFVTDLYGLLREHLDLEIVRAEREVMAGRMSLMDAQLLQVELWEPCFRMKGVAYDSDGQAVENFDARIKGTNCVLKSTLERPPEYFSHKD